MSPPLVRRLDPRARPALERYLGDHAESTIFHKPEWHDLLHRTHGHTHDYWLAFAGSDLVGVLPTVNVHFPILGTKVLAMPYQYHSGLPLATERSVSIALIEHAIRQAQVLRATYLEIRHYCPVRFLEKLGFRPIDSQLVVTSISLEHFQPKRIRRNHRRNVRSARDRGLSVYRASGIEALRLFHRIYLTDSRRLGAPREGWRFFENLYRYGSACYRLFLARLDGRCVGGLLTLDDGRTVFARYAAYSSPEALSLHAGTLLYWEAIADAVDRGCRTYNCGISWSGDSGLIHWKEGWSGETRPAYVYVYPLRRQAPQPGKYFQGFQGLKTVWRRLPLPLAHRLGHLVTHWVC